MNKKVPKLQFMEKSTIKKKDWTLAFKNESEYQRWLIKSDVPLPDHRKMTDVATGLVYVKYPK